MNPLKRAVAGVLRLAGWELVKARPSGGPGAGTMESALRWLAPRHPVRTVLDVGASNGSWTELAMQCYPDAAFLLVEAQRDAHEPALRALAGRYPNVHYVIAAAGDRDGTVHFDGSDPFGGAASEHPTGAHDIVVPMTTIDGEVKRRGLEPPFLLKLDTHGFEVPIFEGARNVLSQAGLVVVEAYNFELTPGTLRFHEMCTFLETRGLRCVDLVDVMRRPEDGALWQFDLMFVPRDRPEFRSNSYR